MTDTLPFIVYRCRRLRDGASYFGQTKDLRLRQLGRRTRTFPQNSMDDDIRSGEEYGPAEIVSRHATRKAALYGEALAILTEPPEMRVNANRGDRAVVKFILEHRLGRCPDGATLPEMGAWVGMGRGVNAYVSDLMREGRAHIFVNGRGAGNWVVYRAGPAPEGFEPYTYAERDILGALAAGDSTPPEVQRRTGRDKSTVCGGLRRLERRGAVRQTVPAAGAGRGRTPSEWELVQ